MSGTRRKPGRLGGHVEGYRSWLEQRGYTPLTVTNMLKDLGQPAASRSRGSRLSGRGVPRDEPLAVRDRVCLLDELDEAQAGSGGKIREPALLLRRADLPVPSYSEKQDSGLSAAGKSGARCSGTTRRESDPGTTGEQDGPGRRLSDRQGEARQPRNAKAGRTAEEH